MEYALVMAVIRRSSLEAVEKRLQDMGVRRLTVSNVKGHGEHADFLSRDQLVEQVKIETCARRERALAIAQAILESASIGSADDGLVALLPVEIISGVHSLPTGA